MGKGELTDAPADRSPSLVDKSPARVRGMFSQIAGRYDLLNHLLSLGIDRHWRRRTVRLVPPVGAVLDVCTGTGDLALVYHRAARGQVAVVGVDFARPMLAIARRKARSVRGGRRIAWVEADAERLPFGDGQFQVVSVAFGLRNIRHTDRGLAEMVRVCRPGGEVAVLEFTFPEGAMLRAVYGWYFHHLLPRIGDALAQNRHGAYNYLALSVGQFPQRDQLAERMYRAGLRWVRYWPFTFGIATLYVGTK